MGGAIMTIENIMLRDKIVSFQLNETLEITGVSHNLTKEESLFDLIGNDFFEFLETIFIKDDFKNIGILKHIKASIELALNSFKSSIHDVIVNNDIEEKDTYYYGFSYGVDHLLNINDSCIVFRVAHFSKYLAKERLYKNILTDMTYKFDIEESYKKLGHFILDTKNFNREIIYVDDNLKRLFDIDVSDNELVLSYNKSNKLDIFIQVDKGLRVKLDMMINGEIDVINHEWNVDGKWLKIEARVLKKNEDNQVKYIGAVVSDITATQKHKDIERIQTTYDLAISSGGIGIFHYDFDAHSGGYFAANDIYAKMIGIHPHENGFYLFEDFSNTIQDIEPELGSTEELFRRLDMLLRGDISGTTDDIMKIKNGVTGEILYILSSSKIEERYPNGTPRRLGGIIVDVTERVEREKNQSKLAQADELTGLKNNRKLFIDIEHFKTGFGLFIDLDDFKDINDKFGHLVGDNVLKLFSRELSGLENEYTRAYRLYGDEFFVFIEGNEKATSRFKTLLEKNMRKSLEHFTPKVNIHFSVGISEFSPDMNVEEFIKKTDQDMYKNKIINKSKRKA